MAEPRESTNGYRWMPDPAVVAQSNVGRFMRRHGIASYDQLVRQSSDDPEWFWHGINVALALEWHKPYKRVMDDSAGPAWTKWFVGGRLNVVRNCVDRHAEHPEPAGRPALIAERGDGSTRAWTRAELSAEIGRLANVLARMGVVEGDRVGIFLPRIAEAVVGFLAVAKLGAIAIPISPTLGTRTVADRLIDGQAKALLTADGARLRGETIPLKDVVDEALMFCPNAAHVVVLNHLGLNVSMHPRRDRDWAEATAEESPERDALPVDSEHPLFIAYGNEAGGKPRGAVHVHGGFLVKVAQEVAYQADVRAGDVLHWSADPGEIWGLWWIVGGLALGATLLLDEKSHGDPTGDRLGSLIETHRVTVLGVSPASVRDWRNSGDDAIRTHDLSSLRILASTGEAWDVESWLWCLESVGGGRCPIISVSGGTEVGVSLLSTSVATPLKPATLGRPALGMATELFDAEGRSIAEGEGEVVCVKPWPGMTRGLWNDPDRYLKTFWSRWPEVWVHGNRARIDADGDWFVLDGASGVPKSERDR